MISNDEKNIFLQDLEEEQLILNTEKKEKTIKKKKKKLSATAIFASFSVFFIFMILLMIFVLSLSGTGNPVFKTFGIEPYEIKSFLSSLLNKSFFVIIVILLLSTSIGIFKGYSTPKEEKKKRRGAFVFSSVSGSLIFLSLISWGGAYAFIDKFVTETIEKKNAIEVVNPKKYGKILVAPIDIEFSLEKTIKGIKAQGFKIESIKWSSDGGRKFIEDRDGKTHKFHFTQKGEQKIVASILLSNGKEHIFSRRFTIDDASFEIPAKIRVKQKAVFNAQNLIEGGKKYRWDFDGDGIYEKETSRKIITNIFKRPGTFIVNLRVELGQNSFETYSRKIRVYSEAQESLVATITSDKEFSGVAPFFIKFSGAESFSEEGQIIKYTWIIGKEQKRLKGEEVSYTFKKPGIHPVKLFIENEFGEKTSHEIKVEILKGNSPPKGVISSIPKAKKKNILEGQIPFEVKFSGEKSTDSDNNIVDYQWEIKNEDEKIDELSGSEIEYIFRKPGKFSVQLLIKDQEGASDVQTFQVFISEPKVLANVKATPNSGSVPLIVKFNGSESSCKADSCNVTGFEWDFKDGTPIKRTGATISHMFKTPGVYPVKTTVYTNTKEKDTTTTYITVTEPVFKSCFESSRSKGIAPVHISFNPECSQGKIAEYKWDFGDGVISRAKHPSHTFKKAGDFTVTLHIIDINGRVSEYKKHVSIVEEE